MRLSEPDFDGGRGALVLDLFRRDDLVRLGTEIMSSSGAIDVRPPFRFLADR